ncbi:hypothetical protein ACRQ5Q_14525 [Bradyrhizobium sp. PMVTL-01]|uniref:hypothetical protein n=1 Tax=Bradyrhizobium sp. PMVTL-01 TaxID=3434999 RepID=UPI003F6E92DC
MNFRSAKESTIDIGKVLVVANSREAAEDIVLTHLDLPRSSTSCEVERVKPSIFTVMRGEVRKDQPINGTFPRSQAQLDRLCEDEREPYAVQITGTAWAHSSDNAIRKIGKAAVAKIEGRDVPGRAVTAINLTADQVEREVKSSSFEKNSIFTGMKMFQGGTVSPR